VLPGWPAVGHAGDRGTAAPSPLRAPARPAPGSRSTRSTAASMAGQCGWGAGRSRAQAT